MPHFPAVLPSDSQRLFQFLDGCGSSPKPTGGLQSQPVGIAMTPELEIIFDTAAKSRKFAQYRAQFSRGIVIGWRGEVTVQYLSRGRFPRLS
jgi:hypothetical protein